MSSDKPIPILTSSSGSFVAPTPQNTPLVPAPIGGGLSKPTVPDISEELEELDVNDDDDEDDEGDQAALIQATMLGMVQGKLAGLVGKSSGYIESLPLPVRRRVEGLKGVHTEYSKLEAAYKREVLELEKKYATLYTPVFDRRRQILAGEAEPTEEEIKTGEAQTLKDDPEAEPLSSMADSPDAKAGADIKGVPEFWLTALRNHPEISELITERDEEAIKSLTDIRLKYLTEKAGYTLLFYFSDNAFFTHPVLTKTYFYKDEPDVRGDFVYSHAEGTKIKWKADKDLTKEIEVRKQRNKNTNRTRVVRKAKETPSFFNFFAPPTAPEPDAVENGDMEEEEADMIDFKLQLDYQVGEDLKDRIIPRAIDYFTGKALEYETDYDDDEDDDEDDDGEEEDESGEESDEGFVPPPKKKKGGKAAASGGGTAEAEECKNQ